MAEQESNSGQEMKTPTDDTILDVRELRTYLFTREAVIKAVDGVSFSLRKGETLGIVGESGSGKSMTALSLLAMEPKPAAEVVGGEVWFQGENLLEKSESEMRYIRGRKISMILQDPQSSLNPVLTIGDQLEEAFGPSEPGANRRERKAKARERVVDLLRRVNIAVPERRAQDYPHQMSGGMKQRVVGGISIARTPDIVIADEPTTALDLTIQAQYLRLLREIQDETGVSMIFITHDFGIVARMCDHIVVMYAGKLVERGSVRAIFDYPSHPYTQALINSVPKMEERVERLYSIPGQPPAPGEASEGCPFAPRCVYAERRCTTEAPPTFNGRSSDKEHVADCWKLEDPTWKPKTYSELIGLENTSQ